MDKELKFLRGLFAPLCVILLAITDFIWSLTPFIPTAVIGYTGWWLIAHNHLELVDNLLIGVVTAVLMLASWMLGAIVREFM